MSTTDKPERSPSERTEILERKANIVRSRLLRAVDALDARRHQVERIVDHSRAITIPHVLGAVGIAALLGASAVSFGLAVNKRRRKSLGAQVAEALKGIQIGPPRRSFICRAAESIALSVLSYAATELVRRVTTNAVDGRLLDGRLAVGHALETHHASHREPAMLPA